MRQISERAPNCNSYRTVRQLSLTKQGPPQRRSGRPGSRCRANVQNEPLHSDPILTAVCTTIRGNVSSVFVDSRRIRGDCIRSDKADPERVSKTMNVVIVSAVFPPEPVVTAQTSFQIA